jgi:adenine-specific DNA-methyltransferase
MMLAQAHCRELPLAANSVDLIFTDPPYLREFLPCYGWLAQEAMRVLKPGGFVLAMCGGRYLNQIFRLFDDAGLEYYWKYELEMTGRYGGIVWRNGQDSNMPISTRHKPILAYAKGKGLSRVVTASEYTSGGGDKRFHSWGQDVGSARYFIDCFSWPGDLVLDPFIGGGTTAVACELIGRRCLGLDLDPVALATSALRLAGSDIHHTLPLFAQEAA